MEEKYQEDIIKLFKKNDDEFCLPLTERGEEKVNKNKLSSYFRNLKIESNKGIYCLKNNKVIGFITFEKRDKISNKIKNYNLNNLTNYVTTIIVSKNHRRKGIAKNLYNKLFEISKKNNIKYVSTQT
ncbi:MAG: GNAT family N-acetyltransferase [archaeon]